MSAPYFQLLDATIQHLQDLKAQGVRQVAAAPATVAALARAAALASAPVRSAGPARANQVGALSMPTAATAVGRPGPEPTPVTAMAKPSSPPTASGLVPFDPRAKAEIMRQLQERALGCTQCPHLASSRRNVVFGVGDINAALMFVGEAPGIDEDQQGEPFVGAAGQLLTKIIQTMGLGRDTVYIANILKCRPDTPGQAYGNRKPTAQEMQTCLPFLQSQIDCIQPKVLVALGATAVEGLLGRPEGISRLRGRWQTYRGIPLMPTFHPSYLLRNQALSVKRNVWEDMLQVLERLGLSVSEKQRGYFLQA